MTLRFAENLLQVAGHFRVVLQIVELSSNCLFEVLLQREHISEIAIDRFSFVPCHDSLHKCR
jgi:hypothetical protein